MKRILTICLLFLLVGCSTDKGVDLSDYTKTDVVMTAWQEVNEYDFMIEGVELDADDSIYILVGDIQKECDFLQLHDGGTLFTCEYEFTDQEWMDGFLGEGNYVYYKEND